MKNMKFNYMRFIFADLNGNVHLCKDLPVNNGQCWAAISGGSHCVAYFIDKNGQQVKLSSEQALASLMILDNISDFDSYARSVLGKNGRIKMRSFLGGTFAL